MQHVLHVPTRPLAHTCALAQVPLHMHAHVCTLQAPHTSTHTCKPSQPPAYMPHTCATCAPGPLHMHTQVYAPALPLPQACRHLSLFAEGLGWAGSPDAWVLRLASGTGGLVSCTRCSIPVPRGAALMRLICHMHARRRTPGHRWGRDRAQQRNKGPETPPHWDTCACTRHWVLGHTHVPAP